MEMTQTPYGKIERHIFENFKHIQFLALDVDGVLSDGNIYLGNSGEELKAFNAKDGYGIKSMLHIGVEVAVITGRESRIVTERMRSLGVKHVIQGRVDKASAISELANKLNVHRELTASIGDDIPDLEMFEHSALKVAVCDAHPTVLNQANYVTSLPGGRGAVREICDIILQAKQKLPGKYGASC